MNRDIIKEIENEENKLVQARRESEAWNNGKYKSSSNAKMSKIFVETLEKHIERLKKEYDESL